MHIEVNDQEAELIHYFRTISRFNRERIFSQARMAHEDYQRAQQIQRYVAGGQG